MSTASWTSASLAPAAWAAATSSGRELAGVAAHGPGDVEERLHLVVEPVGRAELDDVDQRQPLGLAVDLEQGAREGAVGVHAVEAVVGGGDGRGEHLALGPADRGPGEVVDEQLVGQPAQVDAQLGRQAQGGEDAGDVGQSADDRVFLGALESFVVAGHAPFSCRATGGFRRQVCQTL